MAVEEPDREVEAYAEDAPLMALFDTPAKTKLLSVFVAERGRDLSKSEIARQAGVARSTVYDHLDVFVDLGVIEKSRTTGDGYSERFQLDEDSEIAEKLHELEGVTLRRLLERDGSC